MNHKIVLALALPLLLLTAVTCKKNEPREYEGDRGAQKGPVSPLQPLESGSQAGDNKGLATETTQALGDEDFSLICCTFPFSDRKILDDFNSGGRSFGAARNGRRHAATDLLKDYRNSILAIADGEILDVYEFYEGTDAVVVDHKFFVARYGEIKGIADGLRIGSQVKKGQKIAEVGRLAGSGYSMLHLELYKGNLTGDLTRGGNEYQRRGDLFDPSQCVKLWMKSDSIEKCWEKTQPVGGN